MITHEGVPSEQLAAISALVTGIMRFDQMLLSKVLCGEALRALGTLGRSHTVRSRHMHIQSRRYIAFGIAYAAFKPSVSVMPPYMDSQVLVASKRLAAVHANYVIIRMHLVHVL